MNIYSISGYCSDEIHISTEYCEIHSFEIGCGFKAEVKASSFRRAQSILNRSLANYNFSFDSFYYVTNLKGKKSFRFIRNKNTSAKVIPLLDEGVK